MSDEMASTAAETKANAREIERLRARSHEIGNFVQVAIAKIEALDGKVDATHTSVKGRIAELRGEMKEDLAEIKTQTSATNGHVAAHDRQISELRGGMATLRYVITVALTILTIVLAAAYFLIDHL